MFKWEKNYPQISKEIDDGGLKVAHVAKSAGLTYGQLYARLTNKIDFELPIMRKLSRFFGVTMDNLFNDKKI
jgi:transketolase C-terminal domain/subunit